MHYTVSSAEIVCWLWLRSLNYIHLTKGEYLLTETKERALLSIVQF